MSSQEGHPEADLGHGGGVAAPSCGGVLPPERSVTGTLKGEGHRFKVVLVIFPPLSLGKRWFHNLYKVSL